MDRSTAESKSSTPAGKAGPGFGRVPTWLAASGLLRLLSKSDGRVLLCIAAHVNGRTWSATLTVGRIAASTGLSERTIQRTTGHLEDIGVLSIAPGGGRSSPNTYHLKPRHPGDTLSVSQTPSKSTETPTNSTGNPDTMLSPTTEGTEKTEEEASSSGSLRSKEEEAVRRLFAAKGVGEPKRTQLATHSGMTVKVAKRVLSDSPEGIDPAHLVTKLTDAAEAAVAEAEEEAEAARAKAEEARRREAIQQAMDNATADELTKAVEAVVQRHIAPDIPAYRDQMRAQWRLYPDWYATVAAEVFRNQSGAESTPPLRLAR